MNKELIFKQLHTNLLERDKYFDSIPTDICMAFMDNVLVDNLLHERDMLIKLIFGDQADAVEWFLYEWTPEMEFGPGDGPLRTAKNIDEYIAYMKEHEGF